MKYEDWLVGLVDQLSVNRIRSEGYDKLELIGIRHGQRYGHVCRLRFAEEPTPNRCPFANALQGGSDLGRKVRSVGEAIDIRGQAQWLDQPEQRAGDGDTTVVAQISDPGHTLRGHVRITTASGTPRSINRAAVG